MLQDVKILFFGTPEFAVPALQALVDHGVQPIVVTAPDKPAGRKKTLTSSPVKAVAQATRLTILEPEKIDDGFLDMIKHMKPDIAVIVAYGKILPKKLLDIPRFGFVNIHPSLLPKYRGASPIQSALLNGENETGVSLIVIDEEVDHGPVLAQEYYSIPPYIYYPELARTLSEIGAELLIKTLPRYIHGETKPQEQDHTQATHTKRFTINDGRINWKKSSEVIFNQIRALSHEPGTWTTWNDQKLKIIDTEPMFSNDTSTTPGTVGEQDGVIAVRTNSHFLKLNRVQLEGSRPMMIKDFITGHPDFVGSVLS